jgi:ribosome-associated heat shock protein Hsp15
VTRPDADPAPERDRLDRWLWQARFFRSRSLASAAIAAGRVRVNRQHVRKPGAGVSPGDVLTFVQAGAVRVVRVLAIGTRRGPAREAQALYEAVAEPGTAAPPPPLD